MTREDTIVEFSEPLFLGGLDWQWEKGDRFALIEAVALCHANECEYPNWVKGILGEAMTNLYKAVYPDDDLERRVVGRKTLPAIGLNYRKLSSNFIQERRHSLDLLGLSTDRATAVQRRRETLRDIYIAEGIADRCKFVRKPRPGFSGVNSAIDKLIDVLAESKVEPKGFPKECWYASKDIIRRAWTKHRKTMVDRRLSEEEDNN